MNARMPQTIRRITVGIVLAVAGGGLSVVSTTPATAGVVPVTVEVVAEVGPSQGCLDARTAWRAARDRRDTAREKVAVEKGQLRRAVARLERARRSGDRARIRTARAAKVRAADELADARTVLRRRRGVVAQRGNAVSRACNAAPAATARRTGTLLAVLGLAPGGTLGLEQLTGILDTLLPGVSDLLDPALLTSLLDGFNAVDALDPADLSALPGGVFDPAQLEQLLAGTPAADVVALLADQVSSLLNDLVGGSLPVPTSIDPAVVTALFSGAFGDLDASQIGALLRLVALGSGVTDSLDASQVGGLLESLLPGVLAMLDPGQLDAITAAFNAAPLDADLLAALLGGQVDPATVAATLAGLAADGDLGVVISQVLAQLTSFAGGSFVLPDLSDPTALLALVTDVVGVLQDLLGGLLGGNPLCAVLPILCP